MKPPSAQLIRFQRRSGRRRPVPLLVRIALLLGAAFFALAPATATRQFVDAQEVAELRITSTHYIVVDAETGEVFAQRGADETVPMASLTKVFTAIEAIEAAPPDRQITTTADDLVGGDATQMGFGPGETYPLEDLLYGMMLPSGNDAARALARVLGAQPGDKGEEAVARFVARANARVGAMGLTQTTLVNPDGWGVPGHHSSAHDLAVFTMYAIRYPRFVSAIGSESYRLSDGRVLTNTNKLLGTYDGLVGGKTGYDDDAGWCLIEVATRGGSTMVSVTLDGVAPDDWYDDNRVLLDYAFDQKARRQAMGLDPVGQVVGYRDPDAAVIARGVTAGASIGVGLPAPDPTVTGGLGQITARPATADRSVAGPLVGNTGAGSGRLLAVVSVVAGLVVIRTISIFGRVPSRSPLRLIQFFDKRRPPRARMLPTQRVTPQSSANAVPEPSVPELAP